MLAGLRKTANQGLTIIIFGAIILVFALNFGPGSISQCGGRIPVAATVNGRIVSEAEFARRYATVFANITQYRPDYTAEKARAENLKRQVLDAMIGDELLAQEAERKGLVISAEELREEIKRIPYFQTDGKFDRQKYAQFAKYQNLSEAKFEEDFSRQLLAQKMRNILEDLTTVSPAEVRDAFESKNNRADIEFVRVDPVHFKKDFQPTAEAVQAVLKDEMKAVEEYYNKHATLYNEPRRVHARHVLVKVSENAAEADVKKARDKIEGAKKRIDAGEDFATVAKEMSEDSTAVNGGDLGLQGPGVWVKPFEDEANRLKAGEVGNIIRTRFGFHIIKVEEVKDASKKELKDVQEQIGKALLAERAMKTAAQEYAQKLLAQAKEGKSLEELVPKPADPTTADPLAPKAETTGWFNKGARYVPRLGAAKEVVDAVFATDKPGLLEQVFESGERLYVVRVREREVPDAARFDAARHELSESLAMQKRSRTVADFIKELRETRKEGIITNSDVVSYDSTSAPVPAPTDDY